MCGLLCSGLIPAAGAATNEEMSRLDEAYPPGSVVICRQDLPGDGMVRLPTRLEIRETVISRKADLTTGRGVATWITHGSTAPGLTLTYMFKQRKNGSGYYSRIDPASMAVSMPAVGPEGKKPFLRVFAGVCLQVKNLLPSARQKLRISLPMWSGNLASL